jgi:hypothetical protein
MLRKLSLLAGVFLVAVLSAQAQKIEDKVELFGGYSYMRFDSSPSTNLNGWELSGQYKVANWLGGVADFGGTYGSGASVHTFLFGPQVSWPKRISPFAHVLLGGAHFSSSGLADTSFSAAIGAGIDSKLAHGISWRVIQGDYLTTRFFGSTQNNARVSTGIVIRF